MASGCLRRFSINLVATRTFRMSAKFRAEEAIKELKEKNPFFEKYAKKISKLQETSPAEFLERVDKVNTPIKDGRSQSRSYTELLNPKKPLEEKVSEIPYKKLEDIMKIDLIKDESAENITKIWVEYHKTKDVLAATMTKLQYKILMDRAKKYPIFILPLPRSEGFEFFLLQFSANTTHFTPLLAYQVHAENAPECLTLVHYDEFSNKGVVLMRGEYDSKVLTGQEAQCLVNELQMFYCLIDENKLKLLQNFTNKPDEFKHMDLIKEVENIQII